MPPEDKKAMPHAGRDRPSGLWGRLRRAVSNLINERPEIEREQLVMLGNQSRADSMSGLFFGLLIALGVDSPVSPFDATDVPGIWTWYIVAMIWAPIMYGVGMWMKREQERLFPIAVWRWRFVLIYVINALVWVALLTAGWSETDVAVQAMMLVLIIGHLTTYLVNLSSHFLTFLIPASLVIIVGEAQLLAHESALSGFSAAIFPLFGAYMLLLGRDAHLRLGDSLRRAAEMKAMAEDLEAARARAVEEGEARSRFFASMSHELRTPLNAIIGFSEVMTREIHGQLGNARYREYAADIFRSGRHLLQIVNDLLDISRLDQHRLELHRLPTPMSDVTAEVQAVLAPLAEARELDLRLPDGGGMVADIDSLRIRQVLINLGSNAIKFTRPGGRVHIGYHRDPDNALRIDVQDNGVGIPAADLETIFDPFRQAQPADVTTLQGQGAGLGLTIARQLVEMHGGTLTLESTLGTGTTATLVLPECLLPVERSDAVITKGP